MVNVIFFVSKDEFSDWLEVNHTEVSELWVGFFKKSTKRTSLTWSEAVDAALAVGWIDGIRKTVDSCSYKIRFTPRKEKSVWSAVNVQKVAVLIEQGKMKPEGMRLFNNRADEEGYSSEHRNVPLARKYEQRIKKNRLAWTFFSNLPPSYKRDSIWWVMSAKKEETRIRRLDILIGSSEAGQKIPTLRKK